MTSGAAEIAIRHRNDVFRPPGSGNSAFETKTKVLVDLARESIGWKG